MRLDLEQSYVVWHGSLSKQNNEDLQSVQRSAVTLIKGK